MNENNNSFEVSVDIFVTRLQNMIPFISTKKINNNINDINEDVNVIENVTRIGEDGTIELMQREIKQKSSEINDDIIKLSEKLNESPDFIEAYENMQITLQESETNEMDEYLTKQLDLSSSYAKEISSGDYYSNCLINAIIKSLLIKCDNILKEHPNKTHITRCKEILNKLKIQFGGSTEDESLRGGGLLINIGNFIVAGLLYILIGGGFLIFTVCFILLLMKVVVVKGIIGVFVGIAIILFGGSLDAIRQYATARFAYTQEPVYLKPNERREANRIDIGYDPNNKGGKKQKRNTRRKRNFRQNKKNTERKNKYYKLTRKISKKYKRYKKYK